MLSIKNNLMAEGASRNLGLSYESMARSVARLSSGLRINSAKDDAAGLAVRELLRADIAQLRQGARNARDGVSMLQTAEGAMQVIDDILIRMKELAEQAATDTYSDTQKGIMQDEFEELALEIDRIVNYTQFNSNALLNDGGASYDIHVGTAETVNISGKDMTANTLGVGGTKGVRSGPYVSDATDIYMTSAGPAETISFAMEIDAVTETLVIEVDGDTTLQAVVDALNVESRGAVEGWNIASIDENVGTGQFVMKLTGWEAGAITTFTIDNDVDGGGVGDEVDWGSDTVLSGTPIAIGHFESVVGSANVDLVNAATAALTSVTDAINLKDAARAEFGYKMNRLEAAAAVIDIQAENLLTAESRISDVDVASEMASLTRTQVLAQAGISMLAQANMMPQMALKLLG